MASLTPLTTPLTRLQAKHLLNRATFGATRDEIDALTGNNINDALDILFDDQVVPTPPIDLATSSDWLPSPVEDINSGNDELTLYFLSWWLEQMRTSGTNIKEKIVYFLHTFITTKRSVVESATALYYQNALFRHYAFGSYKELAYKICFDNAMLIFLDGAKNVNGNEQENFAREFLELYTIGKGEQVGVDDYTNYTEQDVRECAKIFSGYIEDLDFANIDADTGLPQGILRGTGGIASRHNVSIKTLSAAFDNAQIQPSELNADNQATVEVAMDEVQQLVDIIFSKTETAKHICRRLYRFFCYHEISDEVESIVIDGMATELIANDFELTAPLKLLLASEHFFDTDNTEIEDDFIGAIIKSPLELTIGTLRRLKITIPDVVTDTQSFYEDVGNNLLRWMDEQGMPFYDPYEVAGYPAYHQFPVYHRNWISANYLGNRYLLSNHLISGVDKFNGGIAFIFDAVDFVENELTGINVSDPTELVTELIDVILPKGVTTERFEYFLNDILLDDLPLDNWTTEWTKYTVNNNDMVVRMQLENLFTALVQSPEYQLM